MLQNQLDQRILFYDGLVSHLNHSALCHTDDRDDDRRGDRDDDDERDYAPNEELDAADEYQEDKKDYEEDDNGIED